MSLHLNYPIFKSFVSRRVWVSSCPYTRPPEDIQARATNALGPPESGGHLIRR